jgi:hypothetical protein
VDSSTYLEIALGGLTLLAFLYVIKLVRRAERQIGRKATFGEWLFALGWALLSAGVPLVVLIALLINGGD